jgi:hypothetical protein
MLGQLVWLEVLAATLSVPAQLVGADWRALHPHRLREGGTPMPMIEFSDEDLQQLTVFLANASGPGINWVLTNGLLTKLQQQVQNPTKPPTKPNKRAPDGLGDMLDRNTALPQEH